MPSLVTEPGFADPAAALAHFERRLASRPTAATSTNR